MPIVRIDFLEGKAPEYGVQVGLIVARAMTDVLNVPKDDLFQVVSSLSVH
jgi:4-oxalocrotonate tautomerase